jgi:hypothetical protein
MRLLLRLDRIVGEATRLGKSVQGLDPLFAGNVATNSLPQLNSPAAGRRHRQTTLVLGQMDEPLPGGLALDLREHRHRQY